MVRGPACLRRTPHFSKTRSLRKRFRSKYQPACKPGSVGHHSCEWYVTAIPLGPCLHIASATYRTASLTLPCGVIAFANLPRCRPIRFCSRCGLPCRFRCRIRGALLPHLFTLAPSEDGAVHSLWHFPWGHPRRMLSGTVCRWSPDFPPPQPFDHSGSGRPAD